MQFGGAVVKGFHRQAMGRLLQGPQFRCQLGEAARRRVVSEFTHEFQVQRILGPYNKLLQQTGK